MRIAVNEVQLPIVRSMLINSVLCVYREGEREGERERVKLIYDGK